LIHLQSYVAVLTRVSVYTLFRKKKSKFGQSVFASPQLGTPVHLCHHSLPVADAGGSWGQLHFANVNRFPTV